MASPGTTLTALAPLSSAGAPGGEGVRDACRQALASSSSASKAAHRNSCASCWAPPLKIGKRSPSTCLKWRARTIERSDVVLSRGASSGSAAAASDGPGSRGVDDEGGCGVTAADEGPASAPAAGSAPSAAASPPPSWSDEAAPAEARAAGARTASSRFWRSWQSSARRSGSCLATARHWSVAFK
jgi:hypothetical protein